MRRTRGALITLLTLVAAGSMVEGRARAAPVAVCTAGDIIAAENGLSCPAAGASCSLTEEYEVASGCDLDFGDRDVTVSSSGSILIGSGTVTLSARSFTVAAGGLVDGSDSFGGSFLVTATGKIQVAKNGATGRILLTGGSIGGTVTLQTDGDIVVNGIVRVDNGGVTDGSGGDIVLRAGGDITTGSSSVIDASGGPQGCGGTVDLGADGDVQIGNLVDVGGGDGGSIDLSAGNNVIVRDKLLATGVGDAGSGGFVTIAAVVDVEVGGAIESRGSTGPSDGGCGGTVAIDTVVGDVTILDKISVTGGGPDGGAGTIEVFTPALGGGSITVTAAGRLEAEGVGADSCGGTICLDADGDVTVDGVLLAAGGDSGGDVALDAGRHVLLHSRVEVHGRAAGGSAGTVMIAGGTLHPGSVTITDKVDLSGAICDAASICGNGGSIDVSGCDVTLAASGSLDLRGPGAGASGGDAFFSARRQLTLQGGVDATSGLDAMGKDHNGSIVFIHPSQNPPIVTPGVLSPDPDVPIVCGPGCPQAVPCLDHCVHLCDCGDGTIDEFEDCDGPQGCDPETEVCGSPSTGDACRCIATCGNGVIDPGEECDSSDLGGLTCESLGFPGGVLGCAADCTIDESACLPITCGDGDISDDEVCEPDNLAGESCGSLGFIGGVLACGSDCLSYDDSGCDQGICGDGTRCFGAGCTTGPGNGPEECDDGDAQDDDACLSDCASATCGDEVLCSDAEDCTTGPDGGPEECDNGAGNADNAACLSNCRVATCGDGVICSDPGCDTGPTGGAEECDGGFVCCRSDCSLRTCDDGLACNDASGCCRPDASCDDGNPCTTDTCNLFSGCTHGKPMEGCCVTNSECDDGNVCTDDVCDPGTHRCVNPSNTAPCDDGNGCTQTDTCAAGACVGGDPVVCTALDVCHDPGVCEPATGLCSNPPRTDGSECLDGDLCNGTETCEAGVCTSGTALDCDDGNPCTVDGCEATAGCGHIAVSNGASCADGDRCNGDETCSGGTCTAAVPLECDDGNPCTADSCDAATGCRNDAVPDGSGCPDGDLCNGAETCEAGQCMSGAALACDDGNPCTADSCDAATGCRNDAVVDGMACKDGTVCNGAETCQAGVCMMGTDLDCDDGNACTVDACQDISGCTHTPMPGCEPCTVDAQCDDGNPCTMDACTDGTCDNTNAPEGTACPDDDLCNGDETCSAGTCVAGMALDCNDDNPCTADSCSAALGCQNDAVAAGTPCADGDACNGAETCQQGQCTAGTALHCDDGNPCTVDQCNPAVGCIAPAAPGGTPCPDADVCNGDETCQGGVCTAGQALVCNDGNACTGDTCDPAIGCQHPPVPDGTACGDGDVCNGLETCEKGSCAAGTALECDDDNVCTTDTCDPADGCQNMAVADGQPCADDDVCNGTETCQSGICADGAALDCDDQNPCTTDRCEAASGCAHDAVRACCLGDGECDDGNPCTDDACVANRCMIVPSTASCDDGNACTRRDVCRGSVCVGEDPVVCTAAGQCRAAGVCDPATGTCSDPAAPDGTACDDGDACSEPDSCEAGVCVSTVSGLGGFGCTLERLAVPDLCPDPLPRSVQRKVDRQLKKARKARGKAEQLLAKGATEKKVQKQLKKMQKALGAIEKTASKAERKKNQKQSISAECAETIRSLVAEPLTVLASVQP